MRLALVAFLLLAGCEAGPAVLVDLRTDLVPGAEFQEVEVRLEQREGSAGTEVDRARRGVGPDERFLEGGRVAELSAPSAGTYHVRVRLFAAGGRLAEGATLVRVREDAVVSVRVERACAYAGCAEGQLCEQGECVDEECALSTPGACGETPPCETVEDCPARADCADARCDEGYCFFAMREGACPPTDYCDPQRGCLRFPEQADAGAPTCDDRLVDCDGRPEDCEVNVEVDPNHCGGCGLRCEIDNATALCASGVCSLLICDPGYGDCDLDEASGCETPVNTVDQCGDCGVTCAALETCTSVGQCRCGPRFGTIGGGPACGADETCCGDGCFDLDDTESRCGACDASCAPGERCQGGRCACGSSLGAPGGGAVCDGACCDGACVDTARDVTNCGACGVTCGVGEICQAGECRCGSRRGATGQPACSPSQACCADACRDLPSDPDHCGACGVTCGPGEACTSGACRCAADAGEVGGGPACGAAETCCPSVGGCRTLDSDPTSCGACAERCGGGETCAGGACTCGAVSAAVGDGAVCSVTEPCCVSGGALRCVSPPACD